MNILKMKISLSTMVLLTIFIFLSCRQSIRSQEVPEIVSLNFMEMYPGEDNPGWHLDAHGNFEAHFKQKGIKYRADYSKEGDWIETETSIKTKELPKAIRDVIEERFKYLEITEVEKVQSASKGLFYDVEFKRKGKNKDVEFREDGTILYITP